MTDEESNELEILVNQLVREANELLSAIIQRTKESDSRSRLQKSKWTERHRLHVLLEVAEETKKSLPKGIVAPWLLAELKATIELIRRWYNKPIWKDIEPSLVNSTHFTHTIAKLHIVEHLEEEGHEVKIVPKGKDASPDLMVQAIGGTEDWITIECYQPRSFGGGSKVSVEELEKIVKKSMKKAKRQIGKKNPGILAICGFNQTKATLENLKQMIMRRLLKSERSNLCGIWLMILGIVYRRDKDKTSFTPTKTIHFIPNPSYFGRVDVVVSTPKDDPRLIRESLVDISTEDLISQKIDKLSKVIGSTHVTKAITGIIQEERLKLVEEPAPMSRVVIYSKDTLPLFRGEGNINYICGQCGAILMEHGWKLSLSNMILKCPSCQSLNEVPKMKDVEHPIIGRIAIKKENYNFKGMVTLRRGVLLVGL